jgi:hypothetical protein
MLEGPVRVKPGSAQIEQMRLAPRWKADLRTDIAVGRGCAATDQPEARTRRERAYSWKCGRCTTRGQVGTATQRQTLILRRRLEMAAQSKSK